MKKLRWTQPWFLISGIRAEGTREVTFAVMEFLEKEKREARGARREE